MIVIDHGDDDDDDDDDDNAQNACLGLPQISGRLLDVNICLPFFTQWFPSFNNKKNAKNSQQNS